MLDGHGILVLDFRQIRVVGSGKTQNIKVCVSTGQVDSLPVVHGNGDHIVGHPADDVAEEAGVEDNIAAGDHIGGNFGPDAGLHVVAGDSQVGIYVEQQTFQGRNGAFLCNGPACDGNGALQQDFFTGEFHHKRRLPLYQSGWVVSCKKEKNKLFLA